jgi:hypothetical protein
MDLDGFFYWILSQNDPWSVINIPSDLPMDLLIHYESSKRVLNKRRTKECNVFESGVVILLLH